MKITAFLRRSTTIELEATKKFLSAVGSPYIFPQLHIDAAHPARLSVSIVLMTRPLRGGHKTRVHGSGEKS